MSFPISISKTSEQLPVDPLLVVTRAAIGLGLGIMMADKIKPSIRQAAAIALVAIGALAAAPWLVKITLGQINRPESEWGSRARLRSIRGDSGYTTDTDIYSPTRCRGVCVIGPAQSLRCLAHAPLTSGILGSNSHG